MEAQGQAHSLKEWVGNYAHVEKTGMIFGNSNRLRAPSPSLRFHARVGLAELELQTRALEKVLYQGEVRLVGSSARPEVAGRS